MAGGPRYGAQYGVRRGPVYGPSNKQLGGGIPGVTRDSTSNIYVPSSSAEWTTFIAASGLSISNPSSLWLCQEPSGNLADTIGSHTLTANGAMAYQQSVPGWTRLGITATDGQTHRFSNADVSLPDISTNSQLLLGILRWPSNVPAAARGVLTLGANATRMAAQYTTGQKAQATCAGNTVNGTADPTNAVHPAAVKIDRTGSAAAVYTDQEKIVPTFNAAAAGKLIDVFQVVGGQTAAAGTIMYLVEWENGAAEISDANMKALLQAMGFSIPWS